MSTTKKNKPIEYALEIYKPQELQDLPAADECRHYHSDTPFPAIHAGDHINPWMWKFPDQDFDSLTKAMGDREVSWNTPIGVVTSVLHEIIDTAESYKSRVIVFTRMFDASVDKQ